MKGHQRREKRASWIWRKRTEEGSTHLFSLKVYCLSIFIL